MPQAAGLPTNQRQKEVGSWGDWTSQNSLSRRAHPPPSSRAGGGGEARSPETWMVCCLSSPGLPARVPGPPSPPSPRVKPILPNPKGRQAGLCFSEPNMLRWTDRHPVTAHLRGVRLSVQGCHVPASNTKPPATHWHGEALSNQPVVTSRHHCCRTHGKQRGPGIRPRALCLGHPVSWEQEAFKS